MPLAAPALQPPPARSSPPPPTAAATPSAPHQGVVVLDLLHGRLGRQGRLDHRVRVQLLGGVDAARERAEQRHHACPPQRPPAAALLPAAAAAAAAPGRTPCTGDGAPRAPPGPERPADTGRRPATRRLAHLVRGNLGARVRLRVLGLWNTTEKRGLRDCLKEPFLTALAALVACALAAVFAASLPARGRGRCVARDRAEAVPLPLLAPPRLRARAHERARPAASASAAAANCCGSRSPRCWAPREGPRTPPLRCTAGAPGQQQAAPVLGAMVLLSAERAGQARDAPLWAVLSPDHARGREKRAPALLRRLQAHTEDEAIVGAASGARGSGGAARGGVLVSSSSAHRALHADGCGLMRLWHQGVAGGTHAVGAPPSMCDDGAGARPTRPSSGTSRRPSSRR